MLPRKNRSPDFSLVQAVPLNTKKHIFLKDSMGSQIFPIILIVIGTFFLLSNLDFLPMGQVKAILREWWPLILIVVGVLQLRRR